MIFIILGSNSLALAEGEEFGPVLEYPLHPLVLVLSPFHLSLQQLFYIQVIGIFRPVDLGEARRVAAQCEID